MVFLIRYPPLIWIQNIACEFIQLSVEVEKITNNVITSHDPETPLLTD